MSFTPIPFVSPTGEPRVDLIQRFVIQSGQITVATTGNSDLTIIVPPYATSSRKLIVESIYVAGGATLTANDTNYVTWTATNVTNSNAVMLSTADTNTTKATGGSTLTLNSARSLVLTSTAASLKVSPEDVILLRTAATGTLANTVTAFTAIINYIDVSYKG